MSPGVTEGSGVTGCDCRDKYMTNLMIHFPHMERMSRTSDYDWLFYCVCNSDTLLV